MDKPQDRAMTIKDVAKFLNISTQMVYNLINDGSLPAFKIGSASRIMFADVQQFIERQKSEFLRQRGTRGIGGAPVGDVSAGGAQFSDAQFTVDGLRLKKGDFVLDNISFSFPRGKILALLGPSGSGKTLLLRAIAGLERPESGAIFLGRMQLHTLLPRQRRIGYVFENYALFPHLTSKGNIDFPLKVSKKPPQVIEAETAKRLEELDIDPAYLGTLPPHLPEGMKQLVAIARGKNHEFDLFVMDEPMSHLDAAHHVKMRLFLQKFVRDMQQTTITAFHNPDDALAISDYIGVLGNGRLLQFGETWEVYQHPTSVAVLEMVSNFGVNVLRVEVRQGRTLPYNLAVDAVDGSYDLAFRPEDCECAVDGIPIEVATSQFLDNKHKLAYGHLTGNEAQKITVMLPVDRESDVLVCPTKPYLFPVRT